MPDELQFALASLRPLLLDADRLVRAVAAGRRRGAMPTHQRAELRPVDLKAGRRLQVVLTERAPVTRNLAGEDAATAVDALLAEPYGNWHVETVDQVVQLRVTKKGQAQVHTARTSRRSVEGSGAEGRAVVGRPEHASHDRVKERLLDPADPLFDALGADADKRRQIDAFLRLLAPTVRRAVSRPVAAGRPLHVVDLGCGNAYLTFAAHRYLSEQVGSLAGGIGVRTVGLDVRADLVARNAGLAERLGLVGLEFVVGAIDDAEPGLTDVDIVLALHACDTATDGALARGVRWRAPVLLAAPCCHHDVQRQLAARQAAGEPAPHPYAALTRYGILRERFADVLTDALRAELLRQFGYRVEVVEFIDSRHTPRNALIRAEYTGAVPDQVRRAEYADLAAGWGLRPWLADLLARYPPDVGQCNTGGGSTMSIMTDVTEPAATGQIITALAGRYQSRGYQQVAVPAATLLTVVPRGDLEHALAALLDAGDLVAVGNNGIALHPSARIALLSRTVLDQWVEKVSRETGHTFGMYRDAIAAELASLTAWASTATLPDDLAQRAAELAGVLATREMDPRAMDVVASHGGTAHSRLAAVAAMAPGSCPTTARLLDRLRHAVSTVRSTA